jgi:transposase
MTKGKRKQGGRQLTDDERRKIVRRYNEGVSVERLAARYHRTSSTVRRVIARASTTGNGERIRKLDMQTRLAIRQRLLDDPTITVNQLRQEFSLDTDVSWRTVQRYLRKCGFMAGANRRQPIRICP